MAQVSYDEVNLMLRLYDMSAKRDCASARVVRGTFPSHISGRHDEKYPREAKRTLIYGW